MEIAMIDRRALALIARWLLFATLIIVIDIRVGGFDLINDLVGAVLVMVGVFMLRKAVPEPAALHPPLLVLAGVAFLAAIAEQVDPASLVTTALGWSNVVGAWLTARLLAEALAAEDDDIYAAQWSASERLLLWLGILPIAGLSVAGWLIDSSRTSFDPITVVMLLLAGLPLLHLLVSLYRTALLSPHPDGGVLS